MILSLLLLLAHEMLAQRTSYLLLLYHLKSTLLRTVSLLVGSMKAKVIKVQTYRAPSLRYDYLILCYATPRVSPTFVGGAPELCDWPSSLLAFSLDAKGKAKKRNRLWAILRYLTYSSL